MNLLSGPIGRSRRMEREENAKLEEKKRELSRQIELSWRFGQLRGKLGDFEKDKIWKAHEDAKRQEEVERQLSTISEEGGAENSSENMGRRAFRAVLEMVGIREISHGNLRLTQKKRCYGTMNWEGAITSLWAI